MKGFDLGREVCPSEKRAADGVVFEELAFGARDDEIGSVGGKRRSAVDSDEHRRHPAEKPSSSLDER